MGRDDSHKSVGFGYATACNRFECYSVSSFSINRLNFSNLQGDLWGGVTASIVALPLALAFGVASGAGALAGLYGAICCGLMSALFGGTNTQISGPTGPMTIVSAMLFTQFGQNPAIAFTVVMMTGVMQMLFGFARIGRYVNLLPYPVIFGFITGIGVILIFMQIAPLTGHPSPGTVTNAVSVLPAELRALNPHALLVGVSSALICFFTPERIRHVIPPPLLALVFGTVCALTWADIPVIGVLPMGLPTPVMPSLDNLLLGQMISTALVLAALSSIDSLLTSLVADNATATFHNPDKELFGQGLGNLLSGWLGGIAGAGATVRTVANIRAGGRTPLAGVIHSAVLLAIAMGLGFILAEVPHAVLAGILTKVGIDIIDWRFIRRLRNTPRADQILMLTCLFLSVFVDVITAVGIGIVLASLTFVKQAADIQSESIRAIAADDEAHLLDEEQAQYLLEAGSDIQILHLSGLMSFGAANEMARRFSRLGDHKVLVLDLCDVSHIDGSAGLELETATQRAIAGGRDVIIIGMNYRVARVLTKLGLLDLIKETKRFSNRSEGLRAARDIALARRENQA